MDTKGGKLRWGGDGGVLNWAIGTDMYTLMCIKLMPNKNLQYKKTRKQNKKKQKKPLEILILLTSWSARVYFQVIFLRKSLCM